jgi:hypothetical protein
LRGDIFAARRDDQIFFAVGNAQKTVRIEFSDIPGCKPTILEEDFRRFFRSFVVAFGDVGAFG